MRFELYGVIVFGLALAAAIGALALGNKDLALALGTGAFAVLVPSPVKGGSK